VQVVQAGHEDGHDLAVAGTGEQIVEPLKVVTGVHAHRPEYVTAGCRVVVEPLGSAVGPASAGVRVRWWRGPGVPGDHPEAAVLPERTRHLDYGAVAAVWGLLADLDAAGLIDQHAPAVSGLPLMPGTYLALAVLNRVVDPYSKSGMAD
jgi:hypothetical protein